MNTTPQRTTLLRFSLRPLGTLLAPLAGLFYLANAASAFEPATPESSGYILSFSDEFSGTTLDTAKWSSEWWWGPLNEGTYPQDESLPNNITVANGIAQLKATRGPTPAGKTYGTAVATTYQKFSQTYGYWEARLKMPASAKGIWPAFWILPEDTSWPPEIDIMEWLGVAPNYVTLSNHYGTVQNHLGNTTNYSGPDFSAQFHTFGMLWTPTSITWYVDGTQRFQTSSGVPNVPMYVLLNINTGGWEGSNNFVDASTVFPCTYSVDYVRVYRPPTEIIVDNADPAGVTKNGQWTTSSFTAGYYGSNYLHDGNTQGNKSVVFTPNIPTAGAYTVSARWTADPNRSSIVPIDVFAGGTTALLEANQRTNGGQWIPLGTYSFAAGTGNYVRISNTGANGYVVADAVKFTPFTGLLEAESLPSSTTPGKTASTIVDANGSGGSWHKLNGTAVSDFVSYTVNVPQGTYSIKVRVKKDLVRGMFQLAIDNANQGTVQDQYSASASYVELNLGSKTFTTAGERTFKFTVTGRNANSNGYTLSFDYIKLTP